MIEDTLKERGKSYGDFIDNATIAQELKDVVRGGEAWFEMPPDMREAVHMICSKISRMVTGDPWHIDNWTDIQGFAKLVEDRLNEKANKGTNMGGDENYLSQEPLSFEKWFTVYGYTYNQANGFYANDLTDEGYSRNDLQCLYEEYRYETEASFVGGDY